MFAQCTSLISVTLPDNVTVIGNDLFDKCTSLTSVVIPESITVIGGRVFANCTSLEFIFFDGTEEQWDDIKKGDDWDKDTGNYKIYYVSARGVKYTLNEDGKSYSVTGIGTVAVKDILIASRYKGLPVTAIGSSAFYGCTSITRVTMPDSITSIGMSVFRGCTSLTSVVIPDGVTSIGTWAFYDCTALNSVTIPVSVSSIASYVFANCFELSDITYNGSKSQWEKIKKSDGWDNETGSNYLNYTIHYRVRELEYTLNEDGKSYTVTGNGTVTDKNLIIPSEYEGYPVTAIGSNAFADFTSLTNVVIPDSVTSIKEEAFMGCTSLTKVTMSNSVTSIRTMAFVNCSSLASIDIPASVTFIGAMVFDNCSALTNINFSGTKEQWNNIEKGMSWGTGAGNYTIHCVDGNIAKS